MDRHTRLKTLKDPEWNLRLLANIADDDTGQTYNETELN